MSGPAPKDPNLRQRRNKPVTATVLEEKPQRSRRVAPQLPERPDGEWHRYTQAFWTDVWASPMAKEYLDADVHGLYILAELIESFWRAPNNFLAAEIRLQRQCFGLTPIDRRRLQWEVARAESTKRPRNKSPQSPPGPSSRRRVAGDPRQVLQLVV